ncbi:MAG TPA: DNA methyltransferase, partial [Candidatus Limnocylindrales bacterium]
MTALVIRADARQLPLPDDSVDLIVTSPPYYALRSYTDGGEHYTAQIGAEATPAEYIASLIECTREWVRVLKPTGSLWVNLGDSYYSGKGAPGRTTVDGKSEARTVRRAGGNPLDGPSFGIGRKSLVLLPERYRIAAVDELGLIARAVVVWSKPNGLPESVTDRVRRSHEDWVHLTKQPRYYSAVDEIRETHAPVSIARSGRNRFAIDRSQEGIGTPNTVSPAQACNPLGKLPGSVWEIPTEPLTVPEHLGVDHFAAFPTEWPRRIILGWSPSGICTACGEGRRPVRRAARGGDNNPWSANGSRAKSSTKWRAEDDPVYITGEACGCLQPTAPTTPAVVLDPFGGTGTTALVAHALGRVGISVDRSADYCHIARWRTSD